MIKLNNKNITYVALADSSNSIKAPKEIWYADSSNSVKLVYRRKDALIEGEDYEKYHLLNGYTDDGVTLLTTGADIGVNAIPLDNKVFTIELGQVSRNVCIFGKSPWFIPMWCMYANNQYIMQLQERNGNNNTVHNMTLLWNTSNVVTLDFQNKVAKLGNNSFNIDGSDYNFDGFHSIIWQNPRTVGKIKISDELHLVPCKLLKPVPKWLDANGIRRNIGECGMIDLVSGKFYGNVNSVGTFTVENYYERKEWLKVQTTTQTGTYLTLSLGTSMNFSFKRVWLSDFLNTWYFYTPGYVYLTDNHRLITIWDSTNSVIVESGDTSTIDVGDIITIKSTPNLLLINGKTINRYNYVSGAVSLTNAVAREITSLTSSITVDGVERYIPCTLIMDLPASMDANNIARTKGTSGMWDLVSDRFYGNVASSGTFKAVNLAEGVDYEVHKWLKTGSGNPFIQVANGYNTDNDAYLETTFKSAAVNVDKDIIIGFGSDNSFGYRLFVGGQAVFIDIHKRTSGVLTSKRLSFSYPPYQVCHVFVNSNRYEFNNVAGTYELGNGFDTGINQNFTRIFTNQNNNDMHYAETKMRVNNVEYDLVPVRLLRPLPAYLDANGIARQAGECGMYDTVNDKFYGNVASSGSFTVEDDS